MQNFVPANIANYSIMYIEHRTCLPCIIIISFPCTNHKIYDFKPKSRKMYKNNKTRKGIVFQSLTDTVLIKSDSSLSSLPQLAVARTLPRWVDRCIFHLHPIYIHMSVWVKSTPSVVWDSSSDLYINFQCSANTIVLWAPFACDFTPLHSV